MEENEILVEETQKEPITKKDPKRVEQGKRLAAISKQAKEEKMRKKIKEENFSYIPYILYAVAGLSSAGLFYMIFLKSEKEDIHPITIIKKDTPPPSPKKPKFNGFD